MSCRAIVKQSLQQKKETFALVSWPEENNDVSVISDVRNRISAPLSVGELCSVGYGKKTFPAMVHAVGSEEEMNKMMGDYIAGTHDLFGVAIDPPQSTETDTPPSPNTPPPSSVTTPPQSIEPSPPLRPSSATVAATASPMAPPRRKKRKLSDKENLPKMRAKQQKPMSAAAQKRALTKKGQKVLLVTPHGGVRPQIEPADSAPVLLNSKPASAPAPAPTLSNTLPLFESPSKFTDSSFSLSPLSKSPQCSTPLRVASSVTSILSSLSYSYSQRSPASGLPSPLARCGRNLAGQFRARSRNDQQQEMWSLGERVSDIERTQTTILQALSRLEQMVSQASYMYSPFSASAAAYHSPSLPNVPDHFPSTPLSGHHRFEAINLGHHFQPNTGTPPANEATVLCATDKDPLPLRHLYHNKPLPSSEIDKSDLVSVDYVMKGMKAKSLKPSTVTQLLARESYFGESLMARCTPSGTKDLPALPKQEMLELKKTVFRAFPKYSVDAFETEWKSKCWTAIEQACGRTRRLERKY